MAFLTSYRQVLSVPGAAAFSTTGIVARLPVSMATLGIVLLVEHATGSYGTAGQVAAAYTVSSAALAMLQGRLIDRLGQAPVLRAGAVVFAVAMTLLVLAQTSDWPGWITYVTAGLGGGTLPQISACVRARWSHVLRGRPAGYRELPTAFALESVFDEVVYMVGPMLATVLATQWYSWSGLMAAVLCGLVGTLVFAAQRGTEPPSARTLAGGSAKERPGVVKRPLPWRTVLPLGAAYVGIGAFFGGGEVTTVAFADEAGSPGASGVLLAVWALGSLLAGLVAGTLPSRRGPEVRLKWGMLAIALSLLPMLVVEHLVTAGVFLLLAGLTIAPTMIAGYSLAQSVLPAERLTEGMAVLQAGTVIGTALGAALSGVVIDEHGASAAFAVGTVSALLGALTAQLIPRGAAAGARTSDPAAAGHSATVE